MRYTDILNENTLSDHLLDRLHDKRGAGVWITPNAFDIILPHGQHDSLSYGRFPQPGDDPKQRDMIPWNARAIDAGWIRGRSSQEGAEMNFELCSGPATAKSLPNLTKLLKSMDMLERIYVEVRAPGEPSASARQLSFDSPRAALSAINQLVRSSG